MDGDQKPAVGSLASGRLGAELRREPVACQKAGRLEGITVSGGAE